MSDFWGVCSLVGADERLQQFDLSPFFLNKNFKHKIEKGNFFTFGSLVNKDKSNSISNNLPYWNLHKSVCIVMDARIDNRDELITKLYTDCSLYHDISNEELILATYEKWGIEFVKNIIGDFAVVLWDSKEKQLVCVRDRIGLKTFYYYKDRDFFIFASEILPLLHSSNYQPKPNINSMIQFLHFPTELEYGDTMYDEIHSLPPAHILILKQEKIELRRYWFPEKIKINHTLTFDIAQEKFNKLFEKAVYNRLDSSSITGIELSGGLDSSSIAVIANKYNDTYPIISYSMVFGEYKCDETKYIQSVLNKTSIENIMCNSHNIDFKTKYNLDYLYQINPVWPNFVNSAVKLPLIQKIKEKNINIVLTGLGGDETLSGSMSVILDYYKSSKWKDLWIELKYYNFNPKVIYRYLLIPLLSNTQKRVIKRILNFLHIGNYQISTVNDEIVGTDKYISLEQSDHIRAITSKYFSFWTNANFLNALQQFDIEYRHPFYDTELIEFLFSLPPGYRYKEGISKRLLREGMKDLLSEEVYSRNDKAEFSEIVYNQIQAIDLDVFWKNKYISTLGIVSENEIEETIIKFKNLTSNNDYTIITPLWRLINLEKWYRVNFID